MYYIRGGENTSIRGKTYGSWEIVTHDGTVMVSVAGGMSFAAVVHLCKAMNADFGRGASEIRNDHSYYQEFSFERLQSETEDEEG